MKENSIPTRTLYSVQAGRGVAAAMVVVYHAVSMFAMPKYGGVALWNGWELLGKHGVDFFFVLSGFIIFHAHKADFDRPDRASRFGWKRAIRIYPTYWLFLAVFLLLNSLGGSFRFGDPMREVASAITLVRFSGEKLPLQVGWTLCHEILFYAIFVTLIFSRRIGLVVMACWLGLILCMHSLVATNSPTAATVVYDILNLDFFFGIAIAHLMRPLRAEVGKLVVALGLVTFIFAFMVEHWGIVRGEELPSVFYGASSAAILFGIVGCELGGSLTVGSGLKRLGDATFTIYLSHPILLSVLLKVGAHTASKSWLISQAYVTGLVATSLLVGYGLYRFVEKPILQALRNPPAWRDLFSRHMPTA